MVIGLKNHQPRNLVSGNQTEQPRFSGHFTITLRTLQQLQTTHTATAEDLLQL